MTRAIRFLGALALGLALGGCRRQPPADAGPPPATPPQAAASAGFGVRVAAAAADSLHVRFTVTVHGSLQLGIHAPMFAMRPDSTLLLVTPADLTVTRGTGSAVIAAADSGVVLVATPLDTATTPYVAVHGPVVRFARPDSTQRLTLAAGADTLTPREKRR